VARAQPVYDVVHVVVELLELAKVVDLVRLLNVLDDGEVFFVGFGTLDLGHQVALFVWTSGAQPSAHGNSLIK
jgi:hypothetical protein